MRNRGQVLNAQRISKLSCAGGCVYGRVHANTGGMSLCLHQSTRRMRTLGLTGRPEPYQDTVGAIAGAGTTVMQDSIMARPRLQNVGQVALERAGVEAGAGAPVTVLPAPLDRRSRSSSWMRSCCRLASCRIASRCCMKARASSAVANSWDGSPTTEARLCRGRAEGGEMCCFRMEAPTRAVRSRRGGSSNEEALCSRGGRLALRSGWGDSGWTRRASSIVSSFSSAGLALGMQRSRGGAPIVNEGARGPDRARGRAFG
mmetsp:Transcript_17841/g.52827  ORF Transcript_17841/g.52827 Transcript_17841/m.52827 type:complete len:259 (+) Transcript_17841:283-1059(+)